MLRHEYELTPLRAETTISLSKPLSKLSKDDKVRSNEWRWSDDSTGYSSQVHISNLNQGGSDIMQRLTGFEMGSPRTGKYSTTDVLTILVFPGSHINRQWEGATTSDTSLPETSALLKREDVIDENGL